MQVPDPTAMGRRTARVQESRQGDMEGPPVCKLFLVEAMPWLVGFRLVQQFSPFYYYFVTLLTD